MLYFGHVVRCKIDRISLPAPRRALRDTKYSTIQCRKSIWYVHSGRRPSALSEIEAFISHLRSSLARLCITHRVTEGALIQERQSAGLEKKTAPDSNSRIVTLLALFFVQLNYGYTQVRLKITTTTWTPTPSCRTLPCTCLIAAFRPAKLRVSWIMLV